MLKDSTTADWEELVVAESGGGSPGNRAAERRLGHGEPVGVRDDPFCVRDGQEPDLIRAPFEHVAALRLSSFRSGLLRTRRRTAAVSKTVFLSAG